MISSKRLEKIKKELQRHKGKDINITFTDGSSLKVNSRVINEAFTSLNNDNEFINNIKNKEIKNCSELGKLISIIKQMVNNLGK